MSSFWRGRSGAKTSSVSQMFCHICSGWRFEGTSQAGGAGLLGVKSRRNAPRRGARGAPDETDTSSLRPHGELAVLPSDSATPKPNAMALVISAQRSHGRDAGRTSDAGN